MKIIASILQFILFWPEEAKMQYVGMHSSVLAKLPANSISKLTVVALRGPQKGRTLDDKKALRRILHILIFKALIVTCCLAVGVIYFKHQILLFLLILTILPFIDVILWDRELDKELEREILVRSEDFGLRNIPNKPEKIFLVISVMIKLASVLLATVGITSSQETQTSRDLQISQFAQRTGTGPLLEGRYAVSPAQESSEMPNIIITDFDQLKDNLPEIKNRGIRIFENLSSEFLTKNHGKHIRINVNTGEYMLGDDDIEFHQQWAAKFGEQVPTWSTRIGVPIYGGRSNRLL